MLRIIRLSLITLMLSIFYVANACADALLILGDSLSAGYGIPSGKGWITLLEQQLVRDYPAYTVVNASVSGETTQGALSRLSDLLEKYHPTIVLVELGGNDGLRGFPINIVQQNLTHIVHASKNIGAKVLLFEMHIPTNYGTRYTHAFLNMYTDVAKNEAVPLLPFFMQGIATDPDLMQEDSIHPNTQAQPLLFKAVWPTLLTLLK